MPPSPKLPPPHLDSDEELLIHGRYIVNDKIGSGSFGDIFEGFDTYTKKKVAVKMESRTAKHNQLAHEFYVYSQLKGCEGIPNVYWFGQDGGYNFLIVELLGRNLEQLFTKCRRKLSLKSVLLLADAMLRRLESIHCRGFVHRDIKPENFLVGASAETEGSLYLIDFGLSKRYRNSRTKEHIMYKDGKNLTGTARYASVNAHMGIELSRRDDLESLVLLLVYLRKGSLPWQGLKGGAKQEKYSGILDMKLTMSVTELCQELPQEFCHVLHYVRSLRFDEAPDYRFLRRVFMDLFRREGYRLDEKFDWEVDDESRERKK